MVLVDLTSAFNAVHHEAVWYLLVKLGCPDKFMHVSFTMALPVVTMIFGLKGHW